MNTLNLYLMNISHAGNTSGVDRYIDTLINGLKNYPYIHVVWIHLLKDDAVLFPTEDKMANYIKMTLPVPQQYDMVIGEPFWMRKYNEQVYRLIKHLFHDKVNNIIHLHTLNLIDLAVYIREQTSCKIITHLHCIPWKSLYNHDKKRFNKLYDLVYRNKDEECTPEIFAINNCEQQAYSAPDALVCVTHCGMNFVKTCVQKATDTMVVIPNGMNDFSGSYIQRTAKTEQETFRCLYVGVLSESKGIFYILDALNKVRQKGYHVSLTIAGTYTSVFRDKIQQNYPDVETILLGRIPFEELKKYYQESDVGIIASLQEQASYVAVEMSMYGLPVVTTAVDGLDETFTDEVNALKVNTKFSPVLGLSVDVEMMATQIIRLITDSELRNRLGRNVRKLYETELSLDLMMNRTIQVYEKLKNDIK